MTNIGKGHLLQSVDAQILQHQQSIVDLEKLKKNISEVLGAEPSELDDYAKQDEEILQDFISKKFGKSKYKNGKEAVESFKKDPPLWTDMINQTLFTHLKPPELIKRITEAHHHG